MLSLKFWKALDTAKRNAADLVRGDRGASEFVVVIVLILVVLVIGALFNGTFVAAIGAQINRIIAGIQGIG